MTGEYRAEVRDNTDTEVWRPAVDLDPVPDHNDMATEHAAAAMRDVVTKLNREAGWYKYRTIYVPPNPGSDPMTEQLAKE